MSSGLAQSIQMRLVDFAHRSNLDPNLIAMMPAFAEIEGKQAQWSGFLRRSRLDETSDLAGIVERISAFIGPVLAALASGESLGGVWPPGGPWR